jgi:hypothetical protein
VASFLSEVKEFNEQFKTEGPTSVGTDLDAGTLAVQEMMD